MQVYVITQKLCIALQNYVPALYTLLSKYFVYWPFLVKFKITHPVYLCRFPSYQLGEQKCTATHISFISIVFLLRNNCLKRLKIGTIQADLVKMKAQLPKSVP